MEKLDILIDLLEKSILETAGNQFYAGDYMNPENDEELKRLNYLIHDAHTWIGEYQSKLIQETGISGLKIKFKENFGYYIEVPQSFSQNVPSSFIFRQSMTLHVRFTTETLLDFEKDSLSASERKKEKEKQLFLELCHSLIEQKDYIYNLSQKIAMIDFLQSGAFISQKYHYTRPQTQDTKKISIVSGRHPILEQKLDTFIHNDLFLSPESYIHVISGPNMGGKSTFLRQNALCVILHQIGYDVPAQKAEMGVIDRVFSRVGAGDNIFLGQSTFMVEMQEISYILRHASKDSFVIIDEIGRGTSTYDGMSLAWAILEYLQTSIECFCLFATHYHEIVDHAEDLKGVENYSMAVSENNNSIVFLRKVLSGGLKKSYGIEVARISGIPKSVIDAAKNAHTRFQNHNNSQQISLFESRHDTRIEHAYNSEQYQNLIDSIDSLSLNSMTPIESLLELEKIKNQVIKIKKSSDF